MRIPLYTLACSAALVLQAIKTLIQGARAVALSFAVDIMSFAVDIIDNSEQEESQLEQLSQLEQGNLLSHTTILSILVAARLDCR